MQVDSAAVQGDGEPVVNDTNKDVLGIRALIPAVLLLLRDGYPAGDAAAKSIGNRIGVIKLLLLCADAKVDLLVRFQKQLPGKLG